MDVNDFSVKPDLIGISPGATATIHVRNNTPKNETMVYVTDGSLSMGTIGPRLVAEGSGVLGLRWQLRHYSTTKHFEDVDLVYTAPQLPNGVCSKTVTFRARTSGAMERDVTITVSPAAQGLQESAVLSASAMDQQTSCPVFDVTGTWVGTTVDQYGTGVVGWVLKQTGMAVTGSTTASAGGITSTGSLSGTLTGGSLAFSIDTPPQPSVPCDVVIQGSANVTANKIDGTYSTITCGHLTITGGAISLTKQ
jgi:hypothetical protein